MAQTFTNSEQFLRYMQATYGSANFSQWQSLRKQFYSAINYPAAGSNQFNFFGFSVSGSAGQNQQYTNMPKAGSFGQNHFLLKSIQTYYYFSTAIDTFTVPTVADVNNASADFLHGFVKAGMLEFNIGGKMYAQIPRPFLYSPPADGEVTEVSAMSSSFAGSALADNSLVAYADLNRNRNNRYLVDPNILIEAEQAFDLEINYPSGSVPIIATTKYGTSLYIGVILDGILFRPTQ